MERKGRGGTDPPLSCSQIPTQGRRECRLVFLVANLRSGHRMAFSFFERRLRSYLVAGKRKGDKQSRPEK